MLKRSLLASSPPDCWSRNPPRPTLTMRFAGRAVVDSLSFRIERGELCAFLGHNGAGKSTTMRLLTGALRPTEGTALIAGHDVLTRRVDAAALTG